MNQTRAQRVPAWLLAWLGLILGFSLGLFLDQAANLPFDGNLMPALRACNYCAAAAIPVVAEVVKVNRWTLLGSLLGLLAGALAAILTRARPAAPASATRRLSSYRQAAELARFSRVLNDSLEPQPILIQLHEEALRVTGATCGSSFLLDPESPEHRVALRVGEAADLLRLSAMETAAVSSGHGRIVLDFELEGEAPPHVGVRSALLVPIADEEDAIGLIHLHSDQPGAFDVEFHDFVQVLGAQAAVAIRNARRYAEQSRRSEVLRQRVNQLQQLSRIPNAVRVDRPMAANLRAIAQTMQETADFSLVLISVFAPAGNQLVHTAAAGLPPETFEGLQHLPLPWERLQPFLREENRSERVYHVPHTQTADLYRALDLGRALRPNEPSVPGKWHPDDILLVPLYGSHGEIEGLLSTGAPRDATAPQSLVLDMLEIFAGQAALAIENAHLVTQAEERITESQARAVQLSALTEAAGVIATALRVDEVVTHSLDQLRRVVPYDTAIFWQRELSDGRWRVLGARSYADAIERVIGRIESAQSAVFGEVVTTRSVVYVPDVSRDERFAVKEASTMRSWIGVPVLINGEVLGLLSLEKAEDNFYGAAQVPLALSFANRVAVALENARLYEQSVQRAQDLETENARRAQAVDQRSQRLALLNRIATDLVQARDLAGLLELSLNTLRQALGVELASGLILDSEVGRETGRVLATAHLPPSDTAAPIGFDLATDRLLDRLQEAGVPMVAEAGASAAESVARPEHFAWIGPNISAAMFLPLVADGRLLGLIGLGGGPGREKFTPAEAELGQAIVQQTVTALRYLQLRERAQEQASVQQLTRAIARAGDFSQLYQVIRLQLGELAGIDNLTLALYDSASNRVSFPLIVEKGQPAGDIGEADKRTPGGLVGHILQTRQVVRLSGDVAAQAKEKGLALGLPDQHPVRGGPEAEAGPMAQAFLGAPLLLGDKLIGAVVAHDLDRAGAFDERTERLFVAGAGQIALAIDNLRLFEQTQQTLAVSQERATQFETLTETAVALAATLHRDEVMAAALDQLRRLAPYDAATFWQPEAAPAHRGGEPVRWRAALVRGPDAAARAGQIRVIEPRTPLGDILAGRHPQVVPDMRQDARFGAASQSGAWLGVPVVNQGQVVALLELENGEAGRLNAAHVPLAQALSLRVAQALNNAEQYEASLTQQNELAEQARRQSILNRAAVSLSGMLNLGQVLSAALHLIAEALSVERVGLVVFDESTSKPVRVAGQPAQPAISLASLATNPLVARLRQADGVVTLQALSAEQPVAPDQLAWAGGGIAAGLLAPLVFNGHVVGLLGAGQAQAGLTFTAAATSLAQELCRFAAAAIYEASRYETAQAQLSEQTLVNHTARAISQALDARQLGQLLRAQLEAWLAPAQIRLALYDEGRHEVSFALAVVDGQTVTLGAQAPDQLLRLIIQTQQPLLLPGGDELPQQLAAAGLPANALAPAHSYLGVPLLLGNAQAARVLGVLALADPARAPGLTESHQRVLSTVASQIALVIENRRLFEQTSQGLAVAQERVVQLEALAAALSVIASALYSEDVVGVTLEQFERAIPYDRAVFWRREAGGGAVRELRWRAADARGYPEGAEQLTQMLVADDKQLALFAEVVSTRRVVIVPDRSQDARFQADDEHATRSWLGVPLVNKGEVIGLLSAEKNEPNAYTSSHAASAQILANQITAVLTNTFQYEESMQRVLALDERSRRLAFLNRFAAELGGNLNVGSILQITLKALAESLGVDQATAAVFDETRSGVLALEHYPEIRGEHHLALPGSSLIERFQETPAPVTVEDLAGPEAPARLRQSDWIGQEVRAAMILPLTSEGKLIGLIGLGQSMAGRRFTPGETELSMGLANLAAVAAQNARLYDRTQQRLAEQAGINQITRALARTQEPRALFANLRAQIEAWVGADQIYLAAYDESRNEVSFPLAEAGGHELSLAPRAPSGLVRYLLQQLEPVRLTGEIAQQLEALGIYDTGLSSISGLEEAAAWTSCLAVPLINDERVGGALILANPKRAETFDESHERILSAVGAQVAAAMGQARQFEQSRQITLATQARAAQLSQLSEAASVIAGAARSEQVIELTLEQLRRVIPYDSASLWRRDGPDGLWRLAALRGSAAGPAGAASELAAPEQDPLAEVAATRSALVIADASLDRRLANRPNPPGAWLGVPMISQGQLLAIIVIETAAANGYGPAQASLAQSFANQAAASLANVRQYEDSLRRAFELDQRAALLNRATTRLSQAVAPRDVLAAALQGLAEALAVEQGAALLFDDSRGNARTLISARYPEAQDGAASQTSAANLPLAEGLLLNQMRATLAPVAGDVAPADASANGDSQVLIGPDYSTWIGPGTQSALLLPLVVANQLIGLIGLGHAGQRHTFTPGELELAMTLANQAAITAQNARLYQQTQRRLTELASIAQTSRSISRALDLKPVFENVRGQIEASLHADSFYVAVYDPAKNEVTYPLVVEHGQTLQIGPCAPNRLIAHILETRQSLVLTGDVSAKLAELAIAARAQGAAEPPAELAAMSYLGVPLVAGGNVVGVLAVEDFQRAFAFTDKHERAAATIAAPLAAAIESARLNEESVRRAQVLDARNELLGRLATALSQATSLSGVVQFLAQVMAETFVADVGAALVLDEVPSALLPVAGAIFPDDPAGGLPVFVAAGSPLIQQLQTTLAPITLDELSGDLPARAELTAWLGQDVGAALFLPLIAADQLIGLAAVAQLGRPRQFTSGEVDLAMSLANQAAAAAANARLQAEVQPRLAELAAISRICQVVGGAGSLPQLYDLIANELGAVLEADTLVLALYDAASEALSFPLLIAGQQKRSAGPRAPAGLLAHVLQKRASLLLNGQVEAQLEQLGLTYQPLAEGDGMPLSYLAVPLSIGSQVVGVLAVEDHKRAAHFNRSHEFILNTVAAPIALAVEHLRWPAQRAQDLPSPQSLAHDEALNRALSIANHALGADGGAIYLVQPETGALVGHTGSGLVEKLPAGLAQEGGLVAAVFATRQMIVVDDLSADARWSTEPAPGAKNTGALGTNGHGPDAAPSSDGAPPNGHAPHAAAAGSNGHYRSALATPLLAGDQILGVALFLNAQPAAFGTPSRALAGAAASQVTRAVQAATQNHAGRSQAEAPEQRMAEGRPLVAEPVHADDETIQRLPTAPAQAEPTLRVPVEVGPAIPAEPEAVQSGRPAAWRRLALPAGAVLVLLCLAGAAVAGSGAFKQAAASVFGGAAATASPSVTSVMAAAPTLAGATPVPATNLPTTVPVVVPTVIAAPSATATTAASPTAAASSTATASPTAAPPTDTPLPSPSPTAPLPPDVIGLATVVLPNGVAGRLRDAPNGQVVGGVPGNTQVQVLSGRETTSDQIVWVHIRVANTGQTGWFAESLLKYTATPAP